MSRTDNSMTLVLVMISLKIGSFLCFSHSPVCLTFWFTSFRPGLSRYFDLQHPLSPIAGAAKGASASATMKLVGNGWATNEGIELSMYGQPAKMALSDELLSPWSTGISGMSSNCSSSSMLIHVSSLGD